MPVTNFFHTFVMSYLLVLNEFIFASLVLTYGRGMLQHLPFCEVCAVFFCYVFIFISII